MLCSLFLPYINYVTLYECEHNQLVSFNTNPHWDNQSYTKKNEKERKLFDLVDYDPLFHVIRTTFLPIINLILFQYDCVFIINWFHSKLVQIGITISKKEKKMKKIVCFLLNI